MLLSFVPRAPYFSSKLTFHSKPCNSGYCEKVARYEGVCVKGV